MNCGCCKNLGCFAPGQTIDFGFINPCGDGTEFVFEIWTNGTFYQITQSFLEFAQIELPMTFNENSVTEIKIKLPPCMASPTGGAYYATTVDGACCFRVNGIVATCL